MVTLLDLDGRPQARTLTDRRGTFTLRVPAPGLWQLRVDRIGLASTLSSVFELLAGDTVSRQIEVSVEPVRLGELRAQGDRRCILRPAEGVEIYRLWEEVRKALTAAAWTDAMGVYRYRLTHFARELDPTRPITRSERLEHDDGLWQAPFESLPAEVLLENGFVRKTADGLVYSAPDADVLLSDQFLDTHCFRRQPEGERGVGRGLIGLAFRPVPGRRSLPEVTGVLWVDPETAELRRLDFHYTHLRSVGLTAGEDEAGGTIVFQRMPNGAWIIREWTIRMPVVEETWARVPEVSAAGVQGYKVVAIREEGGRVDEVLDGDKAVFLGAASPAVGRVIPDRVSREAPESTPLVDEFDAQPEEDGGLHGMVRVPGTNKGQSGVFVDLLDDAGRRVARTVTDAAGRFRFDAPPPGQYRLRVVHLGRGEVVSDAFSLPAARASKEERLRDMFGQHGIQVVERGLTHDLVLMGVATDDNGSRCWPTIVLDGTVIRHGGIRAELGTWEQIPDPSRILRIVTYGQREELHSGQNRCGTIAISTR